MLSNIKHEDIITDFNLGNIPQLDNVAAQMAMVSMTETLNGSIYIGNALAEEKSSSLGKLQCVGIKALCTLLSKNPVSIDVISDIISPELFEKEHADKTLKKLVASLNSLEKNISISSERVDLQNFQVFCDVMDSCIQKCSDQEVFTALTIQPAESFGKLQKDNHELYCNVVLTLALRLCEPIDVHEIIQEYKTSSMANFCEKAYKTIVNRIEQTNMDSTIIQSFVHPTDFRVEKIKKIMGMYSLHSPTLQSPISGTQISPIEAHVNKNNIIKAINTIEEHLKSPVTESIRNFEETIANLESLRDPAIQLGLIKVSESFHPVAILQEIIPFDVLSQDSYLNVIGTYLMLKLLEKKSLSVEEVVKLSAAEDFSQESLQKTLKIVTSIRSNIMMQPSSMEVAINYNSMPLRKGLRVIENIVANPNEIISLDDIIEYFNMENMENFDKPEVQMAFISIAKRISDPLIVKDCIFGELQKENTDTLPMLGLRVLAEVAHFIS